MFLDILQSSTYNSGAWLANLTTSQAFVMILIVAVAGMVVQWRLRSVMAKNSQVPLPNGLTGAEIAEQMLREHNVRDVRIVHTGGYLTDHFDPRNKTVNLCSAYSYLLFLEELHNESVRCFIGKCTECSCTENVLRTEELFCIFMNLTLKLARCKVKVYIG